VFNLQCYLHADSLHLINEQLVMHPSQLFVVYPQASKCRYVWGSCVLSAGDGCLVAGNR
jgi:hypothetical protein